MDAGPRDERFRRGDVGTVCRLGRRRISRRRPGDVHEPGPEVGADTDAAVELWELRTREYVSGPAYVGLSLIGLPSEGATPSAPEHAELVEEYSVPSGAQVRLYADGRLIWFKASPPPDSRRSFATGWLEQRLTPAGVELVRQHSNPLEKDPTRLHEWLPASAWEDRRPKAYVPSSYGVCLYLGGPVDFSEPTDGSTIEELGALLPAPAADLLRAPTPCNVSTSVGGTSARS